MKKSFLFLLFAPLFLFAQERTAGRFDNGKMWTFDNPPLAYFAEEYGKDGFQPDAAWFKKAQLGALRFATYCSASFVSPNGLVMTNHHCARESITKLSDGKGLVENGFTAKSLVQERKVDSLFVEQLISIEDVTDKVRAAMADEVAGEEAVETLEQTMTEAVGAGKRVQIIRFYNGGQYSAYTFRRFDDVRLVMAPELQLGFFGGDPDNFTFPRYCLDMSFFRVYENNQPYKPEAYFPFSANGSQENEPVFVIGNPGSTSRSQTVSQLEFRRQYETRGEAMLFSKRLPILHQYWNLEDEKIADSYFSYSNSSKAIDGQLAGLNNPIYMDRRKDAEARFQSAIDANPELQGKYGNLIRQIADNKTKQNAFGPLMVATMGMSAPSLELVSAFERRIFFAGVVEMFKTLGAPAQAYNRFIEMTKNIEDQPAALDKALFAVRVADLMQELPADHPVHEKLMALANGATNPQEIAERLMQGSQLASKASTASAFNGDLSGDNGFALGKEIAKAFIEFQQGYSGLAQEEMTLMEELAQARFAVNGKNTPPDATFSLRIADGRVKGYAYNGTLAPTHTTFYGLYERHYAHAGKKEWALPQRWLNPPASFNKATPLDFVSTNDIIGGNSGSPILNQKLEVVGLVFDGNIESLPGEFIYEPTFNRTISTDSRAIVESIDHIYDLDRLAQELRTGRLFRTEAEADRTTPRPTTRRPRRN